MNDIIFEALKLCVMICVLVIGRYVVPWLHMTISSDKLVMLEEIAKTAVRASQQLYAANSGEERKKYAEKYIFMFCKQYKIDITTEQIDALIEAAVKTMKMETLQ